MKNKKNRKIAINKESFQYEEEMHDLADAIAESQSHSSPMEDPFEDYVEVLRSKIHSNPHIFRSRLTKGYSALLHVLQEGDEMHD